MSEDKKSLTGAKPESKGNSKMMGHEQMALVMEAHDRLFGQIDEINRAWLDSVKHAREAESEFTRRLVECTDPGQAAELCSEWLKSRAANFLADSQRFAGLWLRFYSAARGTANDKT